MQVNINLMSYRSDRGAELSHPPLFHVFPFVPLSTSIFGHHKYYHKFTETATYNTLHKSTKHMTALRIPCSLIDTTDVMFGVIPFFIFIYFFER